MKYRDPSKCELRYDWHDVKKRPCRGKVVRVGTVRLCYRHRMLLKEIVRDANQEARRHPVHRGRAA